MDLNNMDYNDVQEEYPTEPRIFDLLYYTILSVLHTVAYYYENYGWYIFALLVLSIYVYITKIKPHLNAYLKRRDDAIYDAIYHKNPDVVLARLNDQQEKIAKLQERYKRDAEIYKEKQDEREAKKREEKLMKNQNAQASGSRLGDGKSLKSDYNPLMGDSRPGYKAPKKKTCGSGGCG